MSLAVKLLADTFWYCAILAPAFLAFNRFFRLLFGLALPGWWIWVIKNRRQKDLHGVLKDQFLFEARLLMGIGAFELLFLGPAEWQRLCGIFVALYLLCGVFMLRAGRLEENGAGGKGFLPRSAGTLAGMVLAAAILSSGTVYRGVLGVLGLFYERLVLPVLMVLFQLLMGLLSGIFGLFPEIEPLRQEAQMEISGGGPVDWGTEYASLQSPEWLKMLGMLIPLIAAGLLLRFLYRRFTDMGNAAFRAVANNLTTESAGSHVLDAYQGKMLEDGKLDERCAIITGGFWDFARIKDFQFPKAPPAARSRRKPRPFGRRSLWKNFMRFIKGSVMEAIRKQRRKKGGRRSCTASFPAKTCGNKGKRL